MLGSLRNFLIVCLVTFSVSAETLSAAPVIIPHRGGKSERPENTLQAFQECVALGATILELDVQVTKDDIAVVYHPGDLSTNTNGRGKLNETSFNDLQNLDAAYKFEKDSTFPNRGKGYKIPSFESILVAFPTIDIIVDLKSLPADKLIESIAKIANKYNSWNRLIFYSTDDTHLNYLKANYPQAKLFESRKNTIEELLNVTGTPQLTKSNQSVWIGFELVRQLVVSENLALGKAEYPVNLLIWTEPGIKRIQEKLPQAKFVMFGINTIDDYQKAQSLGAYAIYTDLPTLLFNYVKSLNHASS